MHYPNDRHYAKRLAGSYLASLILHTLLAALLFAVVANTSQEGPTEQVSGAEVVSIVTRAPIAAASSAPKTRPPKPSAPRIAPLRHAPRAVAARAPLPPQRHVLSKFAPTAPPNPTPLPQASLQPAPQPTQAVLEPRPSTAIAAVPVPLPSVATIAIVRRVMPAAPSPRPTVAVTHAPQSPAPRPKPVPKLSAGPRPAPGVPSPSPTRVPAPAKVAGPARSPGAKSGFRPGPHTGESHRIVHAAPRPIEVHPSPAPARHAPRGIDLSAKLRALLPHNAVNPTMKEYTQRVSLRGHINPTPPPDVLAKTKYILDESNGSDARRIKMWVTSVRHEGPLTLCTGWLVRYPHVLRVSPSQIAAPLGTSRVGENQVVVLGGGSKAPYSGMAAGLAPIIEADATTLCTMRALTPFLPVAPSP